VSRYDKIRSEMVAGGAVTDGETASGPLGIVGIVAIIGLLVWVAIANKWMFAFIVSILIAVLLHEFGHFITAKWAGMKVTQFFLGFGPKLWSFRRGEVEYGVRALPLGAFVRIIGMSSVDEVDPVDEPRTYRRQPYRWRLLVICAGSIMHFLIAIGLLAGVYLVSGRPETSDRVQFSSVSATGPAARAGVLANDVVLDIDGAPIASPGDLTQAISSYRPGDVVRVELIRDGEPLSLDVTLGRRADDPTAAFMGVGFGYELVRIDHGILGSLGYVGRDLADAGVQSVKGVVTVMNPVNLYQHLTGANDDVTSRPTTLVGATNVSADIGRGSGWSGELLMIAAVNVFFGLFNLVPLLPFDGGHAAIATYERLRSRHGRRYFADVNKMMPVAVAVMTLLGFMLFTGLYLDIARPL
jgi:membrane-associated protease RseP (regulator of RpoE activity)